MPCLYCIQPINNVTQFNRFKQNNEFLYIEIGFWWWRLEIHYQGGACGYFFAQLFDAIDCLVRLAYYLIIDNTKHYFKKFINLFKRNKKEQL